jgi:broad specificity phosphatase PhoE
VLILLRHGRTAANASGLLQGRVDNPLDDVGEAQAAAAGAHIGMVDRVISSPLGRARQTAAAFGVPIDVDDRWVELDYGEWDGRPAAYVTRDEWAAWRADRNFAPPGGESHAQLGARVRAALEDLRAEAIERDVVVVSHVAPIKVALAWALGVDDDLGWRIHLTTASISRVRVDARGAVLLSCNERYSAR